MKNQKNETNIIASYKEDCSISKEEFIKKYKVSEKGLSSKEANSRIQNLGLNEIKKSKPKKWYNYFLKSLFAPFNCILLGIICILLYTDVYLSNPPSYANIIVILILVFASTLLDFFEEFRSNKAAEKLKQMVATTVTVLRNGKEVKIPVNKVTLGDTVLLSSGTMIPADLRIIESKDLFVNQSSLTGESDSVKKNSISELTKEQLDTISDLDTICFMGTDVISGSGKGIVIKISDSTYFGKIADTLTLGKPKNAFQVEIENISKLLIKFMLIMIPIVFALNIFKHGNITAFTFAVAIAITITPLLLPVILSSSLSKGAVRMSKKKTIVKKLDSIENFGAMNILCTDKTGTLTDGKIVLERYLDIKGQEDDRILKHAFLNSYFQTGLKDSMDVAIINRAKKIKLDELSTNYTKIDEIPFDFSRRRLSVIVKDTKKKQMITKGAVEEILNICTMIDYKGKVSPITKDVKDNIRKMTKKLNEEGLRVIAVCQKNDINEMDNFSVADEKNMVLMGFIGFLDPPKESAKTSIEALKEAGIRTIILTGDNSDVTKCVCKKVGIDSSHIVVGSKLDKMTDTAILRLLKKTSVFTKLSPIQKARVVRILRDSGNVVGYIGDGINDSPSLTNSDVGISVDTAVDIAKETADIILLKKDLKVLVDGVTEGRRTFVNLMKYIKLSTSFNFGEVLSVIVASVVLPFLPETPIQLLVEGLIYDFGQMTLPFDNVDKETLENPKRLSIKDLKRFMLFWGPISSCFDLIIFAILWFVLGVKSAALFQTIWFSYSIVSNLFGMHIIRTSKIPFIQSNANKMVYASSIILMIVGLIVPFTGFGKMLGLVPMKLIHIGLIFAVSIIYCIIASFAKRIYIKKYKEWI